MFHSVTLVVVVVVVVVVPMSIVLFYSGKYISFGSCSFVSVRESFVEKKCLRRYISLHFLALSILSTSFGKITIFKT